MKDSPLSIALILAACLGAPAPAQVGRYEIFEASFQAAGSHANPYVMVDAQAAVTRPDGGAWRLPLFWDGQQVWKLRISPDALGSWTFRVTSNDAGLNGRAGAFTCVESGRAGGLRASTRWPSHFERQNGAPFWFLGDTAWGYFLDIERENYHRKQAEEYVKARAAQGFNVIHSMLLSEEGDGNQNGPPFSKIGEEQIDPAYWREVDDRLSFANRQGLTVGLALAWGNKRNVEPFSWGRFPSLAARQRYARYIAGRYSAYDVYFLVSGEWHAEIRHRAGVADHQVFQEFVQIGDELAAADPHGRMIGIHPMTRHGSVREFTAASWMSFGDYQQTYRNLHSQILVSRRLRGPVVNSEYGYYLRDQDGDGRTDKSNSYSAEDMRFASWDIVMAGGYLVTGFGSTYFGGHRNPGPFEVHAQRNRDWEEQVGHLRKFFQRLEWWKLTPADELISCAQPRSQDRVQEPAAGRPAEIRPPQTTYWAMAAPGRTYVVYVRGTGQPVELDLGARPQKFRASSYNPRSGELTDLGVSLVSDRHKYPPPDTKDWVLLLEAVD